MTVWYHTYTVKDKKHPPGKGRPEEILPWFVATWTALRLSENPGIETGVRLRAAWPTQYVRPRAIVRRRTEPTLRKLPDPGVSAPVR